MASKYRIIPEDYTSALSVGHEFRLEFTSFERESEAAFLRLLRRFLTKCDMLFLNDVLITIMKELITNAVKANAKRLYFEKRGLDIRNSQDYAEGMKTFKSEGLRSGSEILTDLELTDYIVKIFFRCTENSMTIAVANNIEMVPEENAKMNARIEKAYSYDDITQAFAENLDDSEGAGLGLIMAMMIYKNAGFSREDFTITSLSGVTTCSLKFAPRKDYREFQNKITDGREI